VLITHTILSILPRRTATSCWTEKYNWNFTIFRPTRRSFLPTERGWTENFLLFFSSLQSLWQKTDRFVELDGECVELALNVPN
jgi:hypothetical protein